MNITFEKTTTQQNRPNQQTNIAAPIGWNSGEEMQLSTPSAISIVQAFETIVNRTLPHAAKITEDVINVLYNQLGLDVSIAYLKVATDAAYHALLLVSQEEFRSPHIQAACILIKKFTGSSTSPHIRFTFGVGTQHLNPMLNENEYKFKYVHSTELPGQLINTTQKEMIA